MDFASIRANIIGIDHEINTPYGTKKLLYADWIASGRLYRPIEEIISNSIGPWVANTHTETSDTGKVITQTYHLAKEIIKKHVNANENDVLLTTGFGMTSAVNKLQRILGLRYCGKLYESGCLQEKERPVVVLSHMEHHSNHTSWYETIAEVVIVPPDENLHFDLNRLEDVLKQYKGRKILGSFTAASNVTGIELPVHDIAELIHAYGGIMLVDYAAAAPYVEINMHPEREERRLDGIFFSPHKFLGGPGSSGILIFNKELYHNPVPDQPGGGTVKWTNPWGEYQYIDDIEEREDGGTPGFLQTIKAALAIKLKETMGVKNIRNMERKYVHKVMDALNDIMNIEVLAAEDKERLGAISFYHHDVHYNLFVRLLNDLFGIQVRGGCACAGTYGHYLLDVSYEKSKEITRRISQGDLSLKPGWVRLSLHPTMTEDEIDYIIEAIRHIAKNFKSYTLDYAYNSKTNEFTHQKSQPHVELINSWFNLDN